MPNHSLYLPLPLSRPEPLSLVTSLLFPGVLEEAAVFWFPRFKDELKERQGLSPLKILIWKRFFFMQETFRAVEVEI